MSSNKRLPINPTMATSNSDSKASGRRNAKGSDGVDITDLKLQERTVVTAEKDISSNKVVDVGVKEEPKRGRGRPPKKRLKQSVLNENKVLSMKSPESFRSIDSEGKETDNLPAVDQGPKASSKVGQSKKRGRPRSSSIEQSSRSSPPKTFQKRAEVPPTVNANNKQRHRMRTRRKRDRQALSDDDDDDDKKLVSDKESKPSVDVDVKSKKNIRQRRDSKQSAEKHSRKKKDEENSSKSSFGHQTSNRKKSEVIATTKKFPTRETSQEEAYKKKFGPKEERTCPHCNVVMSSLHGLAYHIKHQVCRREDEEAKAYLFVKKRENGEAPFPPIRPGALFLTIFGVVEVIQDDRIPDDYGTTLVGLKEKQQAKLIREKQQKKKSKIINQGVLQGKALSQYHLLHKSMLRQLYHNQAYSCCISSQSLPMNHCFSYATICARSNQQDQRQQRDSDQSDTQKRNPLEPVDSYPDRIVECFLRPDIRQRLYGEDDHDDDTKLTKVDVAKQAVQQAQLEATNQSDLLSNVQHTKSTSNYNESKIFIQRRLLHTLYNPNIPVYICSLCGQQFHSSVGHKGHLNSKVCQRKKNREEEEQDSQVDTPTKTAECAVAAQVSSKGRPIRKSIEKSIASVIEESDSCPRQCTTKKSGTESANSSFLQFDPSVSTVYPSVVQALLGPVLSTGEEVRIQRRRRGVNMALVHIDGFKPKKDVERTIDKSEQKSVQNQEYAPIDELSACSSFSKTSFASENKKKILKGNSNKPTLSSATVDVVPSRAKRISNHQGSYIPKVCEDFLEVVRVMDSGRFHSMTRYYGAHADDCCVPYCKNLGKTLYCCEFCSNASHFECLQKKVIVRDWNPDGDFVCHVCLRTVLSRIARHERRMEKKKELLAAEKHKKFVLPTVTPLKSVNPYKFDPAKTALYPEVYEALAFLRKGAKLNIKEKSEKQRKRKKNKKGLLDTEIKEESSEMKRVKVDTKPEDNSFEVSEQSTGATIIDTLVLAEEIRNGRYPSMNLFNGPHEELCLICKRGGNDEEQENTEQQLYYCDFCNKAEHMDCLKSRVKIREIDPETDDFMCHRCILTVVARRVRAERRRLQKREEALEKAGIGRNNPFYQMNTVAPSSSVSIEREASFEKMTDFDSHVTTFDSCPYGGPGGLICCQQCEESYSRLLSDTAKEIESQTVSRVGREVSEMLELLEDAKLRLQQALEASEANDFRRSMCSTTF